MTPESSFEMDDMEFEKELKGLGKKEFVEFRKRFREFSSEITQQAPALQEAPNASNKETEAARKSFFKEQIRILSRKLHLIKKEFEKREIQGRIDDRIKEMLRAPDNMLQIDDADFRDAIHNMEFKEFYQYIDEYKSIFMHIISDRKNVVQQSNALSVFDKQSRDNLKVIKRWDWIEEEQFDREKRVANSNINNVDDASPSFAMR